MDKKYKKQINIVKPTIKQRLKHLRGRHDQLDHAWNRGMGRGSGGGVGDVVTVEQYQAMSKKLDEEVAAGTKTQEVANGIRKNLQKKANDYYDAVTRASLGMARIPRRQRASTQLADIRANDIASAAQQGQLANTNTRLTNALSRIQQLSGGNIMGRLNDLLSRLTNRTSQQQQTPQQEPQKVPKERPKKLATEYDTTRFDKPTEIAPMPLRTEALEPGGVAYKAIMDAISNPDSAVNTKVWEMNSAVWPSGFMVWPSYLISAKIAFERYEFLLNKGAQEVLDVLQPETKEILQKILDAKRYKATADSDTDYGYKPRSNFNQELEDFDINELMKNMTIDQANSLMTDMYKAQVSARNKIQTRLDTLAKDESIDKGWDSEFAKLTEVMQKLENPKNYSIITSNQTSAAYNDFVDDSGEVVPLPIQSLFKQMNPQDIMYALNSVYGYNTKPKTQEWNDLEADSDAMVFGGDTEPFILYRSIRDSDAAGFGSRGSGSYVNAVSAAKIFDDTLHSDTAHVGYGIDGMGMYFKSRKPIDSPDYEKQYEIPGGGIRREQASTLEANGAALKGTRFYGDNTLAGTIDKDARVYDKPFRALTGDDVAMYDSLSKEIQEEILARYGDFFGKELMQQLDTGVLMQLLGYEAYIARSDSGTSFNWVVINRGALTMATSMITPDAAPEVLETAATTGRI